MPGRPGAAHHGPVTFGVHRLGIDVGTSTTLTALAGPDGVPRPQVFDSDLAAGATLDAVTAILERVAGRALPSTAAVLTHPAAWRPDRRRLPAEAAPRAG